MSMFPHLTDAPLHRCDGSEHHIGDGGDCLECDRENMAGHYLDTVAEVRRYQKTLTRLASTEGFVAIGVIPEDQWGEELKARIELARATLFDKVATDA